MPVTCSLVSTILNDLNGARALLCDLQKQTRLPDEFVVTDGGSTDGTYEFLQAECARLPFRLTLIREAGANVSRGRNLAIEAASHEVILTTDFGCRLDSRWVEALVRPFEQDSSVEIVTGSWKIRFEDLQTPAQWAEWALSGGKMELVATPTCLASTRSMAFLRSVWRDFGTYPEDLTLAGDDAIFSMWMVQAGRRIAAAPEAVCYWHRFAALKSYWREARRNFRGAGEAVFFLNFGLKTGFLFVLEIATLAALPAALIALALGAPPAPWMLSALLFPVVWSKRFVRWARAGGHLRRAGHGRFWPWVPALDFGNRARGVWGYWEGFIHGFIHCRDCRRRMATLGINRW